MHSVKTLAGNTYAIRLIHLTK